MSDLQDRQNREYREYLHSAEGVAWLASLSEEARETFLGDRAISYSEFHEESQELAISSGQVAMQQGELVCVQSCTPLHELIEAEHEATAAGGEVDILKEMKGQEALSRLFLFCFRAEDSSVVVPLRRFISIIYQMRPDLLPKARLASLAPWLGFKNRSGLSSFILGMERQTGIHSRKQKKVHDRVTYSEAQKGHAGYRKAAEKHTQQDFMLEAVGV